MTAASPLGGASQLVRNLRERRPLRVFGFRGGVRGVVLAHAAQDAAADGPVFHIADDDASARSLAADAAFFMGRTYDPYDPTGPILVIPEIDTSPYGDVAADPRSVCTRMAALHRMGQSDGPRLVLCSVRSFMRKVMPHAAFDRRSHLWGKSSTLARDLAVEQLERAGYRHTDIVDGPGSYAVRGGVMDVYVPSSRFPLRLEWFGDEIESIRLFDPQTQRSSRAVDECVVHPVRETIVTTSTPLRQRILALADVSNVPSSRSRQVIDNLEQDVEFFGMEALVPAFHEHMVPIWKYFPAGIRVVADVSPRVIDMARVLEGEARREYDALVEAHALACPPEDFFVRVDELERYLMAQPVDVFVHDADTIEVGEDPLGSKPELRIVCDHNLQLRAKLEATRAHKGSELLGPLVERIRELPAGDGAWRVLLVAPNVTHAERIASLLRAHGISPELARGDDPGVPKLDPLDRSNTCVQVWPGSLSEGFTSEQDRLLVLSEREIFGKITGRIEPRRRRVGIASLTQLTAGDLVVHVMHGIGRYMGLTPLVLRSIPGDFVLIEYAGNDKLYLPVWRVNEIERYQSADAHPPKLDRMGGSTFAVKAERVKAEVRHMAEELLQLYAQREALSGHAYPEPDEMFREFEETFPFEETPDQDEAILAVQGDLGRTQPMDRLVCGDVGFGKTEVALRAAFRVASSGKQVAVLAPTTILVQQHYLTFRERMSRFPTTVACLNRFLSPKQRKQVVDEIRAGTIDVVIGTHLILSSDVRFKDLGLVIIDEEQRFGVAHKERFKKLKTQVDVLSMSATPIPRTLHMSLLGIREISLVMTPPPDRLAVRTFLTRASDTVIEENVRKELARGGQVFYVVPRIQGIEEHAVRIRELVPEAKVLVAHGQMPDEMLEQTMLDFVEHRADVLVSTTIIESGLDIPRANTMFVAHADSFGLAQLYQLRGRIGRSKLRAYCFLLVSSLERMNPDARKRLEAIQRHSELGSGFNVASEDLEIRGAGDILGARQSGNIQAIGFEAYARVLQEAVAELRGDPILHESDPELVFDVPAFLPDGYVPDVGLRLDFYRRLAGTSNIDELHAIVEDLRDRFGTLPREAEQLVLLMGCKMYGRRLRAISLELAGRRLAVRLGPDTPIASDVAARLQQRTSGKFRVMAPDRIATTVPASEHDDHRARLLACREALAELSGLAPVRAAEEQVIRPRR